MDPKTNEGQKKNKVFKRIPKITRNEKSNNNNNAHTKVPTLPVRAL